MPAAEEMWLKRLSASLRVMGSEMWEHTLLTRRPEKTELLFRGQAAQLHLLFLQVIRVEAWRLKEVMTSSHFGLSAIMNT